uniref:Uncharacterized protein n=1 Tax=Knipowitschia caucasica TaxID=637954 RepID=A0AAV2M7V1_KNICA
MTCIFPLKLPPAARIRSPSPLSQCPFFASVRIGNFPGFLYIPTHGPQFRNPVKTSLSFSSFPTSGWSAVRFLLGGVQCLEKNPPPKHALIEKSCTECTELREVQVKLPAKLGLPSHSSRGTSSCVGPKSRLQRPARSRVPQRNLSAGAEGGHANRSRSLLDHRLQRGRGEGPKAARTKGPGLHKRKYNLLGSEDLEVDQENGHKRLFKRQQRSRRSLKRVHRSSSLCHLRIQRKGSRRFYLKRTRLDHQK